MMLDTSKHILIVGLGLMGGSYAQGFRKLGFRVSAITRRQSSIDYAIENGIIDDGAASPDPELIGDADLIVFALYPHIFLDWIAKYQQHFKPGALCSFCFSSN